MKKSGIRDSTNHNVGQPDNFLLNEKILIFHNVITLIKSAVNKNKSEYYGNIFLEKGSCKDKFDTRYF